MQRGNVYPIFSDPALHFTEALAQNAGETENLDLDAGISAGHHCRSVIRHLVIVSVQNLAWELTVFGRQTFFGTDLIQDSFLATYRFVASDAKTYTGSPLFHYAVLNVDLPYADFDFEDTSLPAATRGGRLHLMLTNRTLTGKLANAAGAVRVLLQMEPTYG